VNVIARTPDNGIMGIASHDKEGDQTLIYASNLVCNAAGVSRIAFNMLPLHRGRCGPHYGESGLDYSQQSAMAASASQRYR
jgi:hypothetical protein